MLADQAFLRVSFSAFAKLICPLRVRREVVFAGLTGLRSLEDSILSEIRSDNDIQGWGVAQNLTGGLNVRVLRRESG